MQQDTWRRAAMFWSKVEVSQGTNGCWLWRAHRSPLGYGRTEGRRLAHRIAWELANGPIPEGMCVCHACDNPPCCNPDHLFLGSHLDNMRDRDSKGRVAHGASHGSRTKPTATPRGRTHSNATLVEADVLEIRRLRGRVSEYRLAERFGVSRSTIGHIMQGSTWKHLPLNP